VLNAMDIIKKDRNHIFYNPNNTIIPDSTITHQPPNSSVDDKQPLTEEEQHLINLERERVR
jgi:hypothetical protein